MEFTEFAELLKPIIGGSYNTQIFTRTLFESIISEDGESLIEDISENTFKAYYNGQTKINKIAQRILPYIDPELFIAYLENFPESTAQRLCDTFQLYIEDVDLYNVSQKIAYLFDDILKTAASQKRKSTTKCAEKKTHNITEGAIVSVQAGTDSFIPNVQKHPEKEDNSESSENEKPELVVCNLNEQDSQSLQKFRKSAKSILQYCIDHDPSAGETRLSLLDDINTLISDWKYEYREIEDSALQILVLDTIRVLEEYLYYLSDQFLRLMPNGKFLWFRNESWEEGEQLRNVLQPESYRIRCEIGELYCRLYPLPHDNNPNIKPAIVKKNKHIELPEQQPDKTSYSAEDHSLLQEFTDDFDPIMLTFIGENYAMSLIDMSLPSRIKELSESKWITKADSFRDLTLKSHVFGLLSELNVISNDVLTGNSDALSAKNSREKVRNLYVKLHPDLFSNLIPYEVFLDDWNDGEF